MKSTARSLALSFHKIRPLGFPTWVVRCCFQAVSTLMFIRSWSVFGNNRDAWWRLFMPLSDTDNRKILYREMTSIKFLLVRSYSYAMSAQGLRAQKNI